MVEEFALYNKFIAALLLSPQHEAVIGKLITTALSLLFTGFGLRLYHVKTTGPRTISELKQR